LKLKALLQALCGLLAGTALFAIMVLTLVDVAGRKLIDTSVTGSLEVTELLLVAVIFAGLPLVSLKGEHVVFDSLDPLWPPAWRRAQQAVVDLACMVLLLGVAWVMWAKAGDMVSYGDTTAQLLLPLGPFVYGMSLLCAVTALVHGLLMLQPTQHHHIGVEEESIP
jgi:TRAP-type C4-dicarboxylate transport system permease small subunit